MLHLGAIHQDFLQLLPVVSFQNKYARSSLLNCFIDDFGSKQANLFPSMEILLHSLFWDIDAFSYQGLHKAKR